MPPSTQGEFETLAREHRADVFRAAYRLTKSRDEAEDLTQEAMVRAHGAFHRFQGPSFRAWVLRIVVNAHINHVRARKRRPHDGDFDEASRVVPCPAPSPERALLLAAFGAPVGEALLLCNDEQRRAVVLSDVEGLSYQEIADAEGVPVGTVRSRLSRGRVIMRIALRSYALAEGYLEDEG